MTTSDSNGLRALCFRVLAHTHTRDHKVFAASEEAYKQVKLTAQPGKKQRQVEHATVLGAEVHGTLGRVSAPRTRVAVLCFVTALIATKGIITRKLLQVDTRLPVSQTRVCCVRPNLSRRGKSS